MEFPIINMGEAVRMWSVWKKHLLESHVLKTKTFVGDYIQTDRHTHTHTHTHTSTRHNPFNPLLHNGTF